MLSDAAKKLIALFGASLVYLLYSYRRRTRMSTLKGCAVVTGASQGIGPVIAARIISSGLTRIVLAARSVDKLEAVASGLRARFPSAVVHVLKYDQSSGEDRDSFEAKVCKLSLSLCSLSTVCPQLFACLN
jgi:hypothetical protein